MPRSSMRYSVYIAGALTVMGIAGWFFGFFSSAPRNTAESIYDFRINALDGTPVDFARYRGQKLLIVNTASKCGHTPQYKTLQQLHEQYGDRVTILGFPANNFLWQEPGNNEDIAAFCEKNYGVTFQMFEKISVRGRKQHPLYQWLSAKTGKKPSWNFCKYLLDQNGEAVAFYGSDVSPLDESIIKRINN